MDARAMLRVPGCQKHGGNFDDSWQDKLMELNWSFASGELGRRPCGSLWLLHRDQRLGCPARARIGETEYATRLKDDCADRDGIGISKSEFGKYPDALVLTEWPLKIVLQQWRLAFTMRHEAAKHEATDIVLGRSMRMEQQDVKTVRPSCLVQWNWS